MRYYSNTAVETELSTGINNLETLLIVGSTTGWPGTFPYTIVIDEGEPTEELCSVTAVSGTQITVTRGADGTSQVAHAASATVKHCVSAQDFRETQEHIAATSAHGLTGDLVGDTDAQTLTNKDLSASTNSFPSTLVTLTGSQTLTNKTLAAPEATGDLSGFGGAWGSYVPVLSTWAIGNGTISGAYVQIGKIVFFRIELVLGSTSTMSGVPTISLPVAARASTTQTCSAIYVDSGTDVAAGAGVIQSSSVSPRHGTDSGSAENGGSVTGLTPFTWVANDAMYLSGMYEAA